MVYMKNNNKKITVSGKRWWSSPCLPKPHAGGQCHLYSWMAGSTVERWAKGQSSGERVQVLLCVSCMLLNTVFFLHLLGVSQISFEIGKKYM